MTCQYIYVIFAGDAVYIGRTGDLISRMKSHGMLWCDWAVLEITDGTMVRKREAYWLKHFVDLGCHVLNEDRFCKDGCLGHSPETRLKMSIAGKKRWVVNPIICSEETREKLREARQGRIISEETRRKTSKSLRGRPSNNPRGNPESLPQMRLS